MFNYTDVIRQDVGNSESVVAAGSDFFILNAPTLSADGRFPYENEWLIATLCETGEASGVVNLREYHVTAGGFIIILPGQIVAESHLSGDFEGRVLLMSRRFADSLDIGRTLAITTSVERRPYYQLSPQSVEVVRTYMAACSAMIRQNESPAVLTEVLRLLTHACFLGTKELLDKHDDALTFGSHSRVCEEFLGLVEQHYRQNRQLTYYATRLGRSPKYLSRLIREETGRNASDWIEHCVIMDAKAQLLSTAKTVQEISDSLGFPSQSFFGKYFKRITGLSPREFRTRQMR